MRQTKLISNLENISSLCQQCNNSDSHMQSATAVLFSAPRNKFSLLSNRNKINSTISDFHNIAKRLSGDDESGLLKAVLKKDPSLCKALFDVHLLKYIMAKSYPSEYLSPEVVSIISNNINISQSTQHAVVSQSIDRKRWLLENADSCSVFCTTK